MDASSQHDLSGLSACSACSSLPPARPGMSRKGLFAPSSPEASEHSADSPQHRPGWESTFMFEILRNNSKSRSHSSQQQQGVAQTKANLRSCSIVFMYSCPFTQIGQRHSPDGIAFNGGSRHMMWKPRSHVSQSSMASQRSSLSRFLSSIYAPSHHACKLLRANRPLIREGVPALSLVSSRNVH